MHYDVEGRGEQTDKLQDLAELSGIQRQGEIHPPASGFHISNPASLSGFRILEHPSLLTDIQL